MWTRTLPVEQEKSEPQQVSKGVNLDFIRFDTFLPGYCPPGCSCQCHAESTRTQTPPWLRSILGSLFLTYSSIPILQRSACTAGGCQRAKASVRFSYYFPSWLWGCNIEFRASAASLTDVGASLHFTVPRAIALHDFLWGVLGTGSRERLREHITYTGRVYSPASTRADGLSILQLAIHWGSLDVADFLLQYWEPVLRRRGLGRDVICFARRVLAGSSDGLAAAILQKIHAFDPDTDDLRVPSAVHQAVEKGGDVVEALAREPHALDSHDYAGMTPLHRAAQYGNVSALQQLLRSGASINRRTDDNETSLSLAAMYGRIDFAAALALDTTCDIGMTDSYGNTAAHQLMQASEWDVVESMLLRRPALAKVSNSMGSTLLSVWSYTPAEDAMAASRVLQLLLAAGADLENRGMDGMTPLLWAIATDNAHAVRGLVGAGARVDAVSAASRNLLHYAAYYASAGILRYLHGVRISGVNVDLVDNEGKTAWDCLRYIMVREDPYAYLLRTPTAEEVSAFVSLYEDIRNRYLQADIHIFEAALGAVRDTKPDDARAALLPLIRAKEQAGRRAEMETIKTIDLQIREAMWEAAVESLQETIEVLRGMVQSSVWERKSQFDP